MKKNLLIFACIILFKNIFSQPKGAREEFILPKTKSLPEAGQFQKETVKYDESNINNFVNFYIPSAITREGIEPAAISNLNIDFGDDKVKLKWGFSGTPDKKKFLKNSFGVSASAKAPAGARTLFQYNKTPTDISFGLVYSKIVKESPTKIDGVQSSEEAYWFNINLNYSRNTVYLFASDTAFSKRVNNDFTILFSLNHYFNAWYKPGFEFRRNIWNIGLGLGHFSNYDGLDDIILREGNLSGTYFSEISSVIGKIGSYQHNFGLLARGSFFYPISNPISKAYVMLGANLNVYGIGTDNFTANSNGGIYISARKYDESSELLTDIFSFGILADYSSMEKWGTEGYQKKNFKVIFVSQIPLRWK